MEISTPFSFRKSQTCPRVQLPFLSRVMSAQNGASFDCLTAGVTLLKNSSAFTSHILYFLKPIKHEFFDIWKKYLLKVADV